MGALDLGPCRVELGRSERAGAGGQRLGVRVEAVAVQVPSRSEWAQDGGRWLETVPADRR